MLDVSKIRRDFPILKSKYNGKSLVYLDSTASSLKPKTVVNAVSDYYLKYSANIFRGLYNLSEKATDEYESVRKKTAKFLGSKDHKEIVFVRNATEAINLVAYSWGGINVDKNSEMVLTIMEHHSNFVPWQQLAFETSATLKIVDIKKNGTLDLKNFKKSVTPRTRLVSVAHISNVLGTINPVRKIVEIAKSRNNRVKVLVDGAQSVPHIKVDVEKLGCDFFVFSGHKMLGPTGIGVLWAKKKLLDRMLPFQLGGEMIEEVALEKTTFKDSPHKFEAGTPHIAGVIGLGRAIDYLEKIGLDKVCQHEQELTEYALSKLRKLPYVTIYGPEKLSSRAGVIAFNIKNIHPHDVSQILSEENICIRAGHHCAMPLHRRLKMSASCRASFYIYNTQADIDKLIEGIKKTRKIFNI